MSGRLLAFIPNDYEFEAHCVCGNAGRHIVRVRDGEVVEVMDAETAEFVHAADLRLCDTIDQCFDIVRNAIRYGADRIEVSFDPDTRIPSPHRIRLSH
jgi:hypothetical protein